MARGGFRANAGRRKGTKSKLALVVQGADGPVLKHDPLKEAEAIASDPKTSVNLRTQIWLDLASYVYAKKKAITISTPPGQALALQVTHIQGTDD